MNKGYFSAFGAYFFWGLSPIYWKIIASVPALEIVSLRVFWSLPFVLLIFVFRKDIRVIKSLFKNILKYKIYILSAFLLAANWLIWIWAMSNGYIVDASLGYFINPLLNVVIGVLFLHERLRRIQWIALFLALAGVLYLSVNYGHFPWIALSLATSFALYGYIRKTANLGARDGLFIELIFMILPAMALLYFLNGFSNFTLPSLPFKIHFWLSLTGLVTVIPLVTFAYGARKIPYSTLGFIQYIAPTLQFLLGVFIYNENFNIERFTGFSFIWCALIIYTFENVYFLRNRKVILQKAE